jgi:hypothetical protein
LQKVMQISWKLQKYVVKLFDEITI